MPRYYNKPLKFKSPEELQEGIEKYFNDCLEDKEIPTISGLAFYLGTTRSVLLSYEKWEEYNNLKRCTEAEKVAYSNTIKAAKAFIESGYEQALYSKNSVTGAIFTLKNNSGWVDKTEVENTNKDITVTLTE